MLLTSITNILIANEHGKNSWLLGYSRYMVLGNKLINFFCLNRMKGMMLVSIINCNKRLKDGAEVDSPYIATELPKVFAQVGHMILMHVSNNWYYVMNI